MGKSLVKEVYAMRENTSRCVMLDRRPYATIRTADLVRGIAMKIVRMQATVTAQVLIGMKDGDHGTRSGHTTIVLSRFEDGGVQRK